MLNKIDFLTKLVERKGGQPLTVDAAKAAVDGATAPPKPPTQKRQRKQVKMNPPMSDADAAAAFDAKVAAGRAKEAGAGVPNPPPAQAQPNSAPSAQPTPSAGSGPMGSAPAGSTSKTPPASPTAARGNPAPTNKPAQGVKKAPAPADPAEKKVPAAIQKAIDFRAARGVPEPPGDVPLARPNTEPPVPVAIKAARRQAARGKAETGKAEKSSNAYYKYAEKEAAAKNKIASLRSRKAAAMGRGAKEGFKKLGGSANALANNVIKFTHSLTKTKRY